MPDQVNCSCDDFLMQMAPCVNGVLITNPPYGIRLDTDDHLDEFYLKVGNHLKHNFIDWSCYFLSANLNLSKLVRLKPSKKSVLFNGSLECRLFEFKIIAGFNRVTNNSL